LLSWALPIPRLDPEQEAGNYYALGKFIDLFAAVEETLFGYLRALAGLDPDTGRAILSGVRAHDSVTFVKRIAEVKSITLPAHMEDVLSHFLKINDARNLILHHSGVGRFREGDFGRIVSNVERALTAERTKEIWVSEKVLLNMWDDLATIQLFLSHEYLVLEAGRLKVADALRARIGGVALVQIGAWLYKPSQLPRARRANRTPPRSKRPRKRDE
jgi:hypothetical protein